MAAKKEKPEEFPSEDKEFDVAWRALMAHLAIPDLDSSTPLVDSYIRLGLNVANQYNPLLALFGNTTTANTWCYVRPLQENKNTRTGILTGQKNTIKKSALVIIRAMRNGLKAENITTPGFLTNNDKKCYFLPEPNPRTSSAETFRVAAPVPLLSMSSVKHLEHVVEIHNPDTPKSTALPAGVYFIWLLRYVGTVAPTDPSQFTTLLFSRKFRNLSTFLAAQAKQDVWYTACYLSTTGDIGEFSPFLHSTVAQTA
jgi:hypothetical protein